MLVTSSFTQAGILVALLLMIVLVIYMFMNSPKTINNY